MMAEEKKEKKEEKDVKVSEKEVKDELVDQKPEEGSVNDGSLKASKDEKPAPAGKFKEFIEQIEKMSVADLADLVKALEDRFGVSAVAPIVSAATSATDSGDASQEEKATYTVMLKDAGAQKIAVIKAVREINQELGLKEAKDLVDGAPKEVKKDVPKADANEAQKKLETAGATVELV